MVTVQGAKHHGLPVSDFDHFGCRSRPNVLQNCQKRINGKICCKLPPLHAFLRGFCADFIRESIAEDRPFCLSISFKAAHRPVTPDPKFNEVYRDTVFSKPENFGREKGKHLAPQSESGRQYPRFESWGYADDYNNVMKKYHQQVFAVDVAVGKIRETLAELNVAENTIILFTSDNGFMCGSHGYGSKVIPYEESACVPLIIFDPAKTNRPWKAMRCVDR